MFHKILLITKREFLTRVRKKTFLILTILLPLLIVGFYATIIYFSFNQNKNLVIGIKDDNNILNKNNFTSTDLIEIKYLNDVDRLKSFLEQGRIDAYVHYTIDNYIKDSIEIILGEKTGIKTISLLKNKIQGAIDDYKLEQAGIDINYIENLRYKTNIKFIRPDGEEDSKAIAGFSYGIGFGLGMVIYFVLILYGNQVMRGVMEEKINRISEVIISSVKPIELMLGKILGIGLVGLFQFFIWIVLIFGFIQFIPLFFYDEINTASSIDYKESSNYLSFLSYLNGIDIVMLIVSFIFYFLFGYLLYASMFAAVGSLVNEDPQEAQSLSFPIIMPIIISIVFLTRSSEDPNSTIAVVGSMVPFTSPVVMMSRLAHGIPEGVTYYQLLISMLILLSTFIFFAYLSSKIYRIGVLMYGKKIRWKEVIKWIRY